MRIQRAWKRYRRFKIVGVSTDGLDQVGTADIARFLGGCDLQRSNKERDNDSRSPSQRISSQRIKRIPLDHINFKSGNFNQNMPLPSHGSPRSHRSKNKETVVPSRPVIVPLQLDAMQMRLKEAVASTILSPRPIHQNDLELMSPRAIGLFGCAQPLLSPGRA